MTYLSRLRSRTDTMHMASHRCVACAALLALTLAGCALTHEQSKTPRTATEQLLLSQALERSIARVSMPLPDGATVFVETAGLKHAAFPDDVFVSDLVASRLATMGARIQKKEEDASYRVRVVVQALGTDQESSFLGMPPVTSVLLPFALPEMAVYKQERQNGIARLSLEFFERATGRLITSTRWYEGKTYFAQYTLFFFIGLRRTDLIRPS